MAKKVTNEELSNAICEVKKAVTERTGYLDTGLGKKIDGLGTSLGAKIDDLGDKTLKGLYALSVSLGSNMSREEFYKLVEKSP